jgi:hypothetical protein
MNLRKNLGGSLVVTAILALPLLLTARTAAAQSSVPAAITAYANPSNGYQYVIYADWNGNLYGMWYDTGWNGQYGTYLVASYRSYSAGSPLLSYADSDNNGRLFYLGLQADDEIHLIEQQPYDGYDGNLPYGSPEDLTSSYGVGSQEGLGYYEYDGYEARDGYNIPYGLYGAYAPLAGFLDPNGYLHVYYETAVPSGYSYVFQLHEMYTTSDSWTDHQIGSSNVNSGFTSLAAVWDLGGYEEVYTNVGGSLIDTFFPNEDDQWDSYTVTSSGPTGPLAAYSVTTPNWRTVVWGQRPGYSSQQSEWVYNWPGYSNEWTNLNGSVTDLSSSEGAVAINWSYDGTPNGGVFYVGSDQNVYFQTYETDPTNLTSGGNLVTSNIVTSSSPISAFWNSYQNSIHLFYVDEYGYVDEIYCSTSTITGSSNGSWTWHEVGGFGSDDGVAAH